MRARLAGLGQTGPVSENGFINIVITYNTGIAFSVGAGATAAVYAIQAVVLVLVLGAILFLRRPEYVVPLAFVASGAFCNILDRATSLTVSPGHPNAVLDYFQFWAGGAVFNYADTCIVLGFVAIVLAFVVRCVID